MLLSRFTFNFWLLLSLRVGNILLVGSAIVLLTFGGQVTRGKDVKWKFAIALTNTILLAASLPIDKAIRILTEDQEVAENEGNKAYQRLQTKFYNTTPNLPLSEDLPLIESDFTPNQFEINQFLAEVTGVAILGNSGSAKTQLAKYIAGNCGQSQILILDPHSDREADDYPWEGLTVISDYDQILGQLELLLQLLDDKDRTPVTIIADEYPAIRMYAKKQKSAIADDFILRFGSEARKFNKLPIFISQSGNTKALGLEGMGDFLENFALCRLGKVAVKYSRNLPDQTIHYYCQHTPYPMLIGDIPYVHPTHGHYTQVRKGNKPANLNPLTSQNLTIPLVMPQIANKKTDVNTIIENLEKCLQLPLEQEINKPVSCPKCGGKIKGNGFRDKDKTIKGYRCTNCNNTKFDNQ